MTEDLNPTVSEALGLTRPSARPAGPGKVEQLNRYAVTGELGAGGMGRVLEVVDSDLGRTMAAKIVVRGAGRRTFEKFVLEAQVTGQLEHPNIPPCTSWG